LLLLALAMTAGVCSAASPELHLLRNYPEDGSDTSFPVNLGIKLFFDGDVASERIQKVNKSCFRLLDDGGGAVPFTVLYTDTDLSYILVVAEPEDQTTGLGSDRQYSLEIDGRLQSIDGATLGEDKVIRFRTRNSSIDNGINMAMMGVMLVGMIVFSTVSMRRQAKKAVESDESGKVNPYKVAKQTGKSVEEVVEREAKKKKKAAAPDGAGAAPAGAAPAASAAPEPGKRVKRVKGPRPASAAGSAHVEARRAAAAKREKAAAEQRAKGTTRPKKGGAGRKKRR
jgi:hypothetical protein